MNEFVLFPEIKQGNKLVLTSECWENWREDREFARQQINGCRQKHWKTYGLFDMEYNLYKIIYKIYYIKLFVFTKMATKNSDHLESAVFLKNFHRIFMSQTKTWMGCYHPDQPFNPKSKMEKFSLLIALLWVPFLLFGLY